MAGPPGIGGGGRFVNRPYAGGEDIVRAFGGEKTRRGDGGNGEFIGKRPPCAKGAGFCEAKDWGIVCAATLQSLRLACGKPPPFTQGRLWRGFDKKITKTLYKWVILVYHVFKQSRTPCVKCCQNGELSGRRRSFSAIRCPHPLPINGSPPLCWGETRSVTADASANSLTLRVGVFCCQSVAST